MKVLVKSNEIIFLSWVKHLLKENNINFQVFDEFISSTEGSINAFPIRVLVSDNDFNKASELIKKKQKELN